MLMICTNILKNVITLILMQLYRSFLHHHWGLFIVQQVESKKDWLSDLGSWLGLDNLIRVPLWLGTESLLRSKKLKYQKAHALTSLDAYCAMSHITLRLCRQEGISLYSPRLQSQAQPCCITDPVWAIVMNNRKQSDATILMFLHLPKPWKTAEFSC